MNRRHLCILKPCKIVDYCYEKNWLNFGVDLTQILISMVWRLHIAYCPYMLPAEVCLMLVKCFIVENGILVVLGVLLSMLELTVTTDKSCVRAC